MNRSIIFLVLISRDYPCLDCGCGWVVTDLMSYHNSFQSSMHSTPGTPQHNTTTFYWHYHVTFINSSDPNKITQKTFNVMLWMHCLPRRRSDNSDLTGNLDISATAD